MQGKNWGLLITVLGHIGKWSFRAKSGDAMFVPWLCWVQVSEDRIGRALFGINFNQESGAMKLWGNQHLLLIYSKFKAFLPCQKILGTSFSSFMFHELKHWYLNYFPTKSCNNFVKLETIEVSEMWIFLSFLKMRTHFSKIETSGDFEYQWLERTSSFFNIWVTFLQSSFEAWHFKCGMLWLLRILVKYYHQILIISDGQPAMAGCAQQKEFG